MANCGPTFEAVCSACEKRVPYVPTLWFQHIYDLYRWQKGGYLFGPDVLLPDEWTGIGEMKMARQEMGYS